LVRASQQSDGKATIASPAIATSSPAPTASTKKKRAQPADATSSPAPAMAVKKIKLVHKADGGASPAEPKKGKGKKKEEKSVAIIKDEDELME
jgi:hypothetical protein